ncbi:pachytene checkpoint protein 2 homolog isoform X1 [Teleopsis dalmanni]|uniref:pachytene checkpoint protein 2 homolog isoform X1 n=1 Tax=Teleopsis dalmanni TaxID=139649 RepID=UPI0018CD71A5|nr:pachytene checkpoint protein 2 homolog isoform X1 [Teleopsis dalmanni]
MNNGTERYVVHVEVQFVRCDRTTASEESTLKTLLTDMIKTEKPAPNKCFPSNLLENNKLNLVKSVYIDCDTEEDELIIDNIDQNLIFHFYSAINRPMETELFEIDGQGDMDAVPTFHHWILPSTAFVGLWETLIYEQGLKEKLLNFAFSALLFSEHNVNPNVIACNRLILLHGPPGTGKTSLCKALAQKIAIRSVKKYRHTHLIEINSHSLFSKWFSESGKLVMSLFSKIREIVVNKDNLVCVLIDEVESLAFARDSMSSQEPKDAMRVVNALLTQLDSIKEYPNVLILATSNLAKTIDDAFIDRADVKQYIGLPTKKAIRKIYETVLLELMRVEILEEVELFPGYKQQIEEIVEQSSGLSGRSIRKIPLLAHALHLAENPNGFSQKLSVTKYLNAVKEALVKQHNDNKAIDR